MSALPPFLQECKRLTREDYFPRCAFLFRRHRDEVCREAELASTIMNWEDVIASTENAAEQLFRYLLLDSLSLPRDASVYDQLMKDRNVDCDERKRLMNRSQSRVKLRTIVWLSDKVFICNVCGSFDHKIKNIFSFFGSCYFSFYQIMTRAPTVASVGAEVDILLRFLSKHKTCTSIQWRALDYNLTDDLPASLQALKAYVSEAQSPRALMFDVHLSPDQFQVITSQCNKNIHFVFSYLTMPRVCETRCNWLLRSLAALVEAMKNNTCPPKITLEDITHTPDRFPPSHSLFPGTFHALVAALEVTTSVIQLTLSDCPVYTKVDHAEEGRIQLFGAISRNYVLQELILDLPKCTDLTWEALWSAVAVHPALKRI